MNSVTLINHATVLIKLFGVNILTDPVYSLTLGYYIPRLRKPGIPFGELPRIDVILISHADYDHLNMRTLRRLRLKNQSTTVFPRGLSKYGRRTGFRNVVELETWEEAETNTVRITCVPAKHFNKRLPWDRGKTLASGYVVEQNNSTVYFAGDTGYGDHFGAIAERFAVDIAVLPVGAYKPREWFKEVHLNPETSIQAFVDLRAKTMIPIHWGTFKISDEPLHEPPLLLRNEAERRGIGDKVRVLRNGETFQW
ncbi:MAG: MBL fold metallo-hydrolase [Ignavibacteriales bacterium]|nr:MBL fold metallo-hydrolase [Ignavibacteriales bacterium]